MAIDSVTGRSSATCADQASRPQAPLRAGDHAHADHITGAARLIEATGALAAGFRCGIAPRTCSCRTATCCSRVAEQLQALHSRAHGGSRATCGAQRVHRDALLIDGCGRPISRAVTRRVVRQHHGRLFALPDITRVYPSRLPGNAVTIGGEAHNARLATAAARSSSN